LKKAGENVSTVPNSLIQFVLFLYY